MCEPTFAKAPSWADRIRRRDGGIGRLDDRGVRAACGTDRRSGPAVRALSEELEPPLGPVPVTAASFLFWVEPPAGIHHAEDCERVCAAVQSADERLDAAAVANNIKFDCTG